MVTLNEGVLVVKTQNVLNNRETVGRDFRLEV